MRILRPFVLALFTAAIAWPAAADTWTHSKSADAALLLYQVKYKVPSVSVAVAKNGRILYAKGAKWSGFPVMNNNADDLLYRLASCSKPITAILAMELVERNKLDLDKPIRTYVPLLPPFHTYTVGDLLSHLSGVRHYKSGSDPTKGVDKGYNTALAAMTMFMLDPLVNQPRAKYSYSTHAFTILAAAIERVTGKSFGSYALGRFAAWGLPNLRPEFAGIPWPNRVGIYETDNDKADRDNLSWKYAGGGFKSNVRDICKLSDKLMKGQIINGTSRNLMWSRKTLKNGDKSNYGYGWAIGSENGRSIVEHGGSQLGSNTSWRVFPEDGTVIIVLANRQEAAPGKMVDYLASLAFAAPGAAPAPKF